MHIAIHRTNVGMINWSIHLVISYFQPLFCLCFLPLLCDWNFLLHYLFRFPFHSVMCEGTKMISSICYWVRSISPLSCSTLLFFSFPLPPIQLHIRFVRYGSFESWLHRQFLFPSHIFLCFFFGCDFDFEASSTFDVSYY